MVSERKPPDVAAKIIDVGRWLARALVLAVATSAGAPTLAVAQVSSGISRIAYLDGSDVPRWFEGFRRGLSDLGYVEGRNITIERRSADGQGGRLASLADEVVKLEPQVIVASGSRPALAARNATSTIPIVIAFATDPVGLGLVSSLARPGGNVTGLSNLGADLMIKRLELLAELVPGLQRVGVVWAPRVRDHQLDYRVLQSAATDLNLPIESFEVDRREDYDSAFMAASKRVSAVVVLSGPLAFANRDAIVAAAARHKVVSIYYDAEYAMSGGLISYGPGLASLHRRAAAYVDRILKGAKPQDLPVELPTLFDLSINLATARALGLAIPPALLARADDVVD